MLLDEPITKAYVSANVSKKKKSKKITIEWLRNYLLTSFKQIFDKCNIYAAIELNFPIEHKTIFNDVSLYPRLFEKAHA